MADSIALAGVARALALVLGRWLLRGRPRRAAAQRPRSAREDDDGGNGFGAVVTASFGDNVDRTGLTVDPFPTDNFET